MPNTNPNKTDKWLASQIKELLRHAIMAMPDPQRTELDRLLTMAIDRGLTLADIMRHQDARH
jgi:hypothetical protein